MIELTTGVVFLMSSLYGTGHSSEQAHAIAAGDQGETQVDLAETLEQSSLKTSILNSPKAMEAYLRKEFADTPILVDIARCESSFRHADAKGAVIRGLVNSADVGVMQINEKYHSDTAKKLGIDLLTVEGNIEYAKHLYAESGSKPWVHSSKCWNKELATKI